MLELIQDLLLGLRKRNKSLSGLKVTNNVSKDTKGH